MDITNGIDKRPGAMDQESVDTAESPVKSNKLKTYTTVAALCLTIFLAALDTVLITTALPSIAQVFDISDAG